MVKTYAELYRITRYRSKDKKPCDNTLGRALKFYSSVRLEVRRAEVLKQSDQMVGNKTKIKVVKNKIAPPFRTAEVDIMYGEGISHEGELLDLGSDLDIVQKSGAWYSFNDERLGQGRENAKVFLKENKEIANQIEEKIREHYFGKEDEVTTEEEN